MKKTQKVLRSINHKTWNRSAAAVVSLFFSMAGPAWAETKGNVTAEEILEILKSKGIVTEQQYNEIVEKAAEEKVKEEKEYTVKWNNGINVNRNDGAFKVKFGGRIHYDLANISADSGLEGNESGGLYGGNAIDGSGGEFRRARLYLSGTLWENFLFKAQYDFAGGDADFKDMYLGIKNIPVIGTVLFGQMHEPFSLEELTSSNYITFMERSLPTGAFAPSRKTGFRVSNAVLNKRMTWAAGLFFGDSDDDGDSNFDDVTNTDFTARLTGLPLYRNKGEQLLHIGLGYSHQFLDEGETSVRYRNRPEAHLTDVRLVDTGSIDADSADLFNPEMAFVWGPFSAQGEYFWTSVDSVAGGDPTFEGAYVYGSWFITGENRSYSTSSGKFGRVKPKTNFMNGGIGAWELAARWSWLDLNDSNVSGGEQTDITAAINWYLNPNYRLMFNYVYADVEDRSGFADGSADIIQARFQVDF